MTDGVVNFEDTPEDRCYLYKMSLPTHQSVEITATVPKISEGFAVEIVSGDYGQPHSNNHVYFHMNARLKNDRKFVFDEDIRGWDATKTIPVDPLVSPTPPEGKSTWRKLSAEEKK